MASQLDVLDSERNLLDAELNLSDALRAHRAAIADLFKALRGWLGSGFLNHNDPQHASYRTSPLSW